MHQKLKNKLSQNLLNFLGWKTDRKIIVIESDDWGSIRMPSREIFKELLTYKIGVDKCPYNTYDSLESEDDLSLLFDVLSKNKDFNNRPTVITSNFVMTNPDFTKMKMESPIRYENETFIDTYKKYPNHANSFKILQEGIADGLFKPQCHGREHVNVRRWINNLNAEFPETKKAFELNLFGLSKSMTKENRGSYLAAYDFDYPGEEGEYSTIVQEGLELFNKVFHFTSNSFIAPNYCWADDVELTLSKNKVNHIQSGRVQVKSTRGSQKKYIKHFTGETNKLKQTYTVRNCHFEPSLNKKDREKCVDICLSEISNAFFWKKPAIICSHRLNFIGSIFPENRDKNLALLEKLLLKIKQKWPNVEFMSSDELGKIIIESRKT